MNEDKLFIRVFPVIEATAYNLMREMQSEEIIKGRIVLFVCLVQILVFILVRLRRYEDSH